MIRANKGLGVRASILSVGTEITSGQILNRNSTWISEQLERLGITTKLHMAVPDDRALILNALGVCAQETDLIFVTGGLGPTSDDFTRELISEWCAQSLVYDSHSWDRIVERLGTMGIAVPESNRRQCFFPQGAQILSNPVGTADAFALTYMDKKIWAFPGPPRELEAVWKLHMIEPLTELVPPEARRKLYTWQSLGRSEAELAEAIESLGQELLFERDGIELGYRAHRPYVEVKLWAPVTLPRDRLEEILLRVQNAIGENHFAGLQDSDWGALSLELLCNHASRHPGRGGLQLLVKDEDSGGRFLEKLRRALRGIGKSKHPKMRDIKVSEWASPGPAPFPAESQIAIILESALGTEGYPEWSLRLEDGAGKLNFSDRVRSPYRLSPDHPSLAEAAQERMLIWVVEWCFLSLRRNLAKNSPTH